MFNLKVSWNFEMKLTIGKSLLYKHLIWNYLNKQVINYEIFHISLIVLNLENNWFLEIRSSHNYRCRLTKWLIFAVGSIGSGAHHVRYVDAKRRFKYSWTARRSTITFKWWCWFGFSSVSSPPSWLRRLRWWLPQRWSHRHYWGKLR